MFDQKLKCSYQTEKMAIVIDHFGNFLNFQILINNDYMPLYNLLISFFELTFIIISIIPSNTLIIWHIFSRDHSENSQY